MNLQILGKVTDQVGYLVLNESGATIAVSIHSTAQSYTERFN